MTCIAAVIDKGIVYMGADSVGAEVETYHTLPRKDPKVFLRKSFIFGFTDSFRMGQLLAHKLEIPRLPEDGVSHKWMCTEFIDNVRTCLQKGGWEKKKEERESGGTFLVGIAGHLYVIEADFPVGIPRYEYCAMGSLHSTKGQQPKIRIKKALAAAEEFSGYVRGPFVILKA